MMYEVNVYTFSHRLLYENREEAEKEVERQNRLYNNISKIKEIKDLYDEW